MAQPSVAREPSMEEILASIRRIIENNDVDALRPSDGGFLSAFPSDRYDGGDDDAVADDNAEDIHLTIEDQLPSFAPEPSPAEEQESMTSTYSPPVRDEETAYARQPAPARSHSEPAPRAADTRPIAQELRAAVQEEARSISLADVAARVRAASERPTVEQPRHIAANQGSGRAVELRPAPRAPEAQTRSAPEMMAPAAPQQEERERQIELRPAVTATEPRGVPMAENQPVRVVEPDVSPVVMQADKAPVAPPAEASHAETEQAPVEDAKALVSASTGDQVARSFQELAALVNNTPQRSLDEVAEELLRPMLQEWLDDNLPTLVERLVREEIERVARGPRR